MGPHSFKCGSQTEQPNLKPNNLASMGPHSFKCGSSSRGDIFGGSRICFNGAALFQVRKCIETRLSSIEDTCFNGAALFQVRKFEPLTAFVEKQNAASMGPHSFKCGSKWLNGRPLIGFLSFNGAALFQVRKSFFFRRWQFSLGLLQWGRDHRRPDAQFRGHSLP